MLICKGRIEKGTTNAKPNQWSERQLRLPEPVCTGTYMFIFCLLASTRSVAYGTLHPYLDQMAQLSCAEAAEHSFLKRYHAASVASVAGPSGPNKILLALWLVTSKHQDWGHPSAYGKPDDGFPCNISCPPI
jgi:hypothetical protein